MPDIDAMSRVGGISAESAMPAEPLDPRILDEAAAWLAQLHSSDVSDKQREAWGQWRKTSAQHASAWQRAELLINKLGTLPPELAMPALNRGASNAATGTRRRVVLKQLAMLVAVAPASWLAWRYSPWQDWLADHATALGERKDITLADASRLTLDTATSVDVRYNAQQRLIVLHSGQILLQSGQDVAQRPLLVETGQGRLRAIGTRFAVRQLEGHTRMTVIEGAVEISPSENTKSLVVHAGQQVSFTAKTTGIPAVSEGSAAAWTQGMLMADNMRLDVLAAELSRYRLLTFRIHPAVAGLQVSGAFPVSDLHRTLGMLQSTYPLRADWQQRGWGSDLVALSPR